jgi:hypothetical protein
MKLDINTQIEVWKDIKVWQSTHEVERQLGFDHGNITRAANGKYKTVYGYVWKYIEEEKRKESSLLLRDKNY